MISQTGHGKRSGAAAFPVKRLIAILLIAGYAGTASALPTFDAVKQDFRPSDTLILDRDGEPLHRLRTDKRVRRGEWVGLADVSPALRRAMLLSEDRRFYEHSGVDWQAASAAAWGNLWNRRTRGASTITMQLAGLLDEDWRAEAGGRSVAQKLGQTVAAQVLDRRWRKDQILEAYLNLVPFRGELVGIDALSRSLFGKAPHGLDAREAAVAAALVRAPNARPAALAERACGVVRQLHTTGTDPALACAGLDLFVAASLERRSFAASEGIAPHLARRLLAEAITAPASPGSSGSPGPSGSTEAAESTLRSRPAPSPQPLRGPGVIRSTLSAPLQRLALQTLQQQLRELRGRHVEDGAIVVLDNASGEVLAWVGSSGELSQAADVDAVTAPRQAGSTLKPFLYAQAIAERRLTAASLLDDAATHIPTASGLYIPQNYDQQFKGWVSVRTALAASLNVPAVRTLVLVSPDALTRQLRAVGLPLKSSGDHYGYSLALGSPEVNLLALSNSYRTLSNSGRYSPISYKHQPGMRSTPAFTPALDPRAAFIVGDMLSDSLARARTFGIDSVLATRFWTAVKTGTSKDMRDNWAVGYSQRYTVGVWVGNASGAPMHDVSGTSGAAPIWAALMQQLHANRPSHAPPPPPGLQQVAIGFDDNLEARRLEWFLAGTAQQQFAINSIADNAYPAGARGLKDQKNSPRGPGLPAPVAEATDRIMSPVNGSILALDPDIPPDRQRLQLRASGAGGLWRIDGKPLARGAQAAWLPWPGRHVIQLTSAQGVVLDEVRVEVRGAGLKRPA